MMPCDPTKAESTNAGFIDRWKRQKQSKEIEMFGRKHSDMQRSDILTSRHQPADKVCKT